MARQVSDELIYRVSVRTDGAAKTIKELEDQLKAYRAEVKNAAVGSADFEKSLDNMAATQKALSNASKELDVALGKQTKSLGGINEAFDFQSATLGQMKVALKDYKNQLLDIPRDSEEFDSVSRKIRILNDMVKEYDRSLTGSAPIAQRVFEGVKQALEGADVATNKTVRTMGELNILMKSLQKEQANLGVGTKEWEEMARVINQVEKELKEANEESKRFYASLNEETQKSVSRITSLGNQMKASLAGIPALLAAGLSTQAISQAGQELNRLVSEFEKLKFQVSSLTGLTGPALTGLTGDLKAVAETFEVDFQELAVGVNSVSKQFGISAQEALGLVQEGFLKGANANGEYLSILKEYPAQFKAAGQNAESFIALQVRAAQEGVFSDKGLDVVKEFGLRIREQTTATRDALVNAFGKPFSDELLNAVNTGEISTTEALSRMAEKLKTTDLTAQQTQTILADVFGGAGEDAGLDFIKSLDNVETKLENVKGASEEVVEIQRRQLAAQRDLQAAIADLSSSLGGSTASFAALKDEIAANLITGLANLISILKSIPQFVEDNKVAFAALATAFAAFNFAGIVQGLAAIRTAFLAKLAAIRATTLGQNALNAAIRANPIGFLIGLIASLVAIFTVLYNEVDEVRGVIDGAWAAIRRIGILIKDFVVAQFQSLIGVLGSVGEVFKGLFQIISGDWKAGIKAMTDGLAGAASSLVDLYGGNLVKTVKQGSQIGTDAAKAYRDAFNKEAEPVADELPSLLDDSVPELEKSAMSAGSATGKAFNDSAKAEFEKLQAELAKLKLQARIEIAAEGGAVSRIEEERRQAEDALRDQAAFALLSQREQNALLFALNQEYLNKKLDAAKQQIDEANAYDTQAAEDAIATRVRIAEQAAAEIQQAAANDGTLTPELQRELNAQVFAAQEEAADQRLALAEELYEREVRLAEQQYEERLRLIDEALISEAEREKLRQQLTAETATASGQAFNQLIKAQLDYNKASADLAQQRIDAEAREAAEVEAARQRRIEAERARLRESANDDTLRLQARLQAITNYYDLELHLAQGNADAIRRLENEKAEAIAAQYNQLGDRINEAYGRIASTALAFNEAITGRRIENLNNEIAASDQRIQTLQAEEQQTQQAADQATGRRAELLQREVANIQARNEQELAAKQKLEAAKAKEERKAAAIKKAAGIAQSIIDTARAIMGAVAASPITVGQPWVSIIAALGVAQQAAILATKFKSGGVLPGGRLQGNTQRGGIFKGRSHAQGGIRFAAGGVPVEVEGDEIILTRNVYRNPQLRAAASAINEAAGGARFAAGGPLRFAAGGAMPSVPVVQDYGITVSEDVARMIESLGDRIENMRPQVSVAEINTVAARVEALESNGKY